MASGDGSPEEKQKYYKVLLGELEHYLNILVSQRITLKNKQSK